MDSIAYPPVKKPEALDPVARSIAKPSAFAKPATGMGNPGSPTNQKPTRMRPMLVKRGPVRKRKPDKRYVKFF